MPDPSRGTPDRRQERAQQLRDERFLMKELGMTRGQVREKIATARQAAQERRPDVVAEAVQRLAPDLKITESRFGGGTLFGKGIERPNGAGGGGGGALPSTFVAIVSDSGVAKYALVYGYIGAAV